MARKAAWEDLAQADLGPYGQSSGKRWGRLFFGLLVVASATFVVAYYLPLFRAHQKLAEQYGELSARTQGLVDHLAQSETELKAIGAQRDQLQVEHDQRGAAQKLETTRQEGARAALGAKLDKFLKKGSAEISSSGSSLLVAFSPSLLFQPQKLDLLPNARVLLCDVAKLADAKAIAVRDTVADGSALSAPLAKSYPSPWAFSAARAAVVAQVLEEGCSVQASRLSAVGQGKFDPFAGAFKLPGERVELELSLH